MIWYFVCIIGKKIQRVLPLFYYWSFWKSRCLSRLMQVSNNTALKPDVSPMTQIDELCPLLSSNLSSLQERGPLASAIIPGVKGCWLFLLLLVAGLGLACSPGIPSPIPDSARPDFLTVGLPTPTFDGDMSLEEALLRRRSVRDYPLFSFLFEMMQSCTEVVPKIRTHLRIDSTHIPFRLIAASARGTGPASDR
jgi:hypothetical protein